MRLLTLVGYLAGTSAAITAVSQSLFNNITYYATLGAAATIANPCSTPPNNFVVEQQLNTDPNYTNVSATIFRNDNTREYVLAFAASNNSINNENNLNANLVTLNGNFPCGDSTNVCKIHGGFQISYGSATNPQDLAYMVRQAFKSITTKRPTYALTIVGPSLGGALATQAFLDLSNQNYAIKAVWTYGQPRVGNGALTDLIDKVSKSTYTTAGNFYRVTHYDDVVPKLPTPGAIGPDQYEHPQTEYWHSQEECTNPNTAASTFRCFGNGPFTREDPSCNYGKASGPNAVRTHESYPGFALAKCANRPFASVCSSS